MQTIIVSFQKTDDAGKERFETLTINALNCENLGDALDLVVQYRNRHPKIGAEIVSTQISRGTVNG